MARELHDEFGQCLTATVALAGADSEAGARGRPDLAQDARAIVGVARRMMTSSGWPLARYRIPTMSTPICAGDRRRSDETLARANRIWVDPPSPLRPPGLWGPPGFCRRPVAPRNDDFHPNAARPRASVEAPAQVYAGEQSQCLAALSRNFFRFGNMSVATLRATAFPPSRSRSGARFVSGLGEAQTPPKRNEFFPWRNERFWSTTLKSLVSLVSVRGQFDLFELFVIYLALPDFMGVADVDERKSCAV